MKKTNIVKCFLWVAIFLAAWSCTDERENRKETENEGLLRLSVQFEAMTRLAELPSGDEMAVDKNGHGLYNVGVYIYYTDDYESGDLSNPYVRNMEFTVNDGQLIVANAAANSTDQFIYIYDEMTIVAFYPYNAEMSLPENYFKVKADEENYPITRSDYSEQYYIPYRAQTTTNPAIAYYTALTFVPKHTYKVEIVVVAKDGSLLPTSGDVEILPANDPITTADVTVDGKREVWYDIFNDLVNDGTGSDVQQYISYIWTTDEDKNDIKRGDILMKSDKLVLIASQDLYVDEDNVYRYGYNMSTGEIFIPTSTRLVYDVSSLSAVNNMSNGSCYQVCDIDMSRTDWTPISIYNSRYDGGGHQLSDMTINSTDTEVGLFSNIQGNSTVTNVNLVNPQITVNSDNAVVGALVGQLNTPMTDEQKAALIGNLPPGLSDIVREALIQDILATAGNSEANIVSSKVTDPTIIVNGQDPIVGSLVGQAGAKDDDGDSKSRIWDSAVMGGSIEVNNGNYAYNANAYIGGFVGLNQGYITRCYTTTADITAPKETGQDASGQPVIEDTYAGLAYMGTDFTASEGGLIESSFSELPDPNNGVTQFADGWPSWPTYTGNWPILTTGWLSAPGNSFWYSNGYAPDSYPVLQWERR